MKAVRKVVGSAVQRAKELTGRDRLFSDTALLPPVPVDANGKRVLIYTYKWWSHHLAAESVLGRALELRGAKVSFFTCDAPKGACDNFRMEDNNFLKCSHCLYAQQRFLRETSFENLRVSRYLTAADRAEIEASAESDDLDALRAIKRDGVDIGGPAAASAIRYLRVNSLRDNPAESLPTLKGFVRAAMETYLACSRLFEERRFDTMLLQAGMSYSEAIPIALARKHGIPFTTYDFGFVLGTMMFRFNNSISDTDIRPIWDHYAQRDLTDGERADMERYFVDRQFGRNSMIKMWPNPKFDGQPLDVDAVHRRGGKVYAAFTNVAWDTAWSQVSSAFPSMFEWLEEMIRIFGERPQDQLILRIHPAEVRMTRGVTRSRADEYIRGKFPKLPDNVRLIPPEDPLSSYSLLPSVDGILVYTSTLGLEASAMGKPVITGTQVHYSRYGFAREVKSRQDFRDYLENWDERLAGRDVAAEKKLAEKYAYLFFFKLGVAFRYLEYEGENRRPRIRLNSVDDLRPGRDAALDEICDGILNDHPIFVRQ